MDHAGGELMRALLCAAVLLAASPVAGSAQGFRASICGDGKQVTVVLALGQGMTLLAKGLSASGHVFELWGKPSGDWVQVARFADGSACFWDAGEALDVGRGQE